jgi:autotransporter translocation and assembly factor TamB
MTGHFQKGTLLKHSVQRIAKWVISFAAIVIILLSALYLLRSVVVAPSIQRYLANWIESQLGIRVDIGNLSGSYVNELVVTNVTTLKSAPAGPLVALELRRLRVTYHLWSLFNGLNGFLADASIELEGVTLKFDLARDERNSAFPSTSDSSPSFFLPAQLPRIRIRDTSVFLQSSDYATAFRGIEAETRHSRPMTRAIQLHISAWSWTHPDLPNGNISVSAEIEYSAEKMTVRRLMLGQSELAELIQIGMQSLPETIPFTAKLNLAGGKLALDGKLDHSDLHTRIDAQDIDLAHICSLYKPQLPLTGFLSLQADINLPQLRPNSMLAKIDLNLTRGSLFGLAAADLVLHAAARDGTVHLDMLDLRTGENLIQFKEVIFPITTISTGDLTGLVESLTGRFSLECRDLPSLFLLAGVAIPPAVDSIPTHRLALDGELRHGSVYLSNGGLTADGGYLRLEASRIELPTPNRPLKDAAIQAALKIDFSDLSLLSRIFAIPQLTGSLKSDVRVTGTLGTPSGRAWIEAETLSFQGMTYGDVTMKATSDSGTAVIESLVLQRGEDRFNGHGKFHFANLELEDVHLEFKVAELASYTATLWPPGWKLNDRNPQISGAVDGSVTVAGPIKNPSGTLTLDVRQLKLDENPLGNAAVRLRANGPKITLDAMEIHQAEDFITLTGSFDWSSRHFENARLRLAIANVPGYTQNLLSKDLPVPLAIQGTVVMSGPLKEPQARIAVTLQQLPIDKLLVTSLSFKARSSGRRIDIELAEANSAFGRAMISGYLLRGSEDTHFDLQLNQATLSSQGQTLALDKPGRIHISRDGKLSVKDLAWKGPSGRIGLRGVAALTGKSDLYLQISNFSSSGWLETISGDRWHFAGLNTLIHFLGTMDSPSISASGDVAKLGDLRVGVFLSGQFDLACTNDGVVIRRFDWQGAGDQKISMSGTLPLRLLGEPLLLPGQLSVDAKINLSDLETINPYYPQYLPSGGSLQAEAHISGSWKAPSAALSLRCRGFGLPRDLKPMPPGPYDIDGQIRLDGNHLIVKTVQIDSSHLTFAGNGEWYGMPAWKDFLTGVPQKLAGDVSLKGDLTIADLNWLAEENPELRRVSGRLYANLMMQGPVSSPQINARVRLIDAELRPDMDVPSIQSLNLEAVVTPVSLQVHTFKGELGGAAFNISGGATRTGAGDVRVDLRLQGENLLLYRSAGLKLRADTDLTLKGPLGSLELAGEVAISDGRLVKYFDFLGPLKGSAKPESKMGLQLFSIRKPPFRDTVFDVRITSKHPFTIHNNLAKGAFRPELTLTGTGEIPVLSGKIYVDPTRLILPAGRLVFESGVIRFDPNQPDRPTLDLIGQSRMLGYDITMLVEGPYDEPVVTLSSVPPLSNEELLLLVIAGRQPKATDASKASQRQSMNVAVFLGRDLISRWFSSESAEAGESIFERFEVQTGRAVTRGGDETIDARFQLAEGVLRDGDALYLTGEKDVFDFYNAGVRIVFRFK